MQFVIQIFLTIGIFGFMAAGPIIGTAPETASATGVLPASWVSTIAGSGVGGVLSMVLIWFLRDQSKRHKETVVDIVKDSKEERRHVRDILVTQIEKNTRALDNMANKIDKLCDKESQKNS